MKTKYILFRRGGIFYIQDGATGKQASLRTKDETEAKSLLFKAEGIMDETVNVSEEHPLLPHGLKLTFASQ